MNKAYSHASADRPRHRGRAHRTPDRTRRPGRSGHPGRQPRGHADRGQDRRIAGDGSGPRRRPRSSMTASRSSSRGSRHCPRSVRRLAKPPYQGSFFLIDPLDGTKEFIAGRSEFTVNLALVTNGTPLLGIIGAPALGLIWRGLVGRGAERLTTDGGTTRAEPIHTRPFPKAGTPWTVAVSRSHGDARTEAFIDGQARRNPADARLVGQICQGGRRRGRYLSAACPDPRMGYRSRTRHRHRGRRQGHGRRRGPNCSSARAAKDFIVPEFIAWGDPSAAR